MKIVVWWVYPIADSQTLNIISSLSWLYISFQYPIISQLIVKFSYIPIFGARIGPPSATVPNAQRKAMLRSTSPEYQLDAATNYRKLLSNLEDLHWGPVMTSEAWRYGDV